MILFSAPSPQPAARQVEHEIIRRGHRCQAIGCAAAYVRLVNYGSGKQATRDCLAALLDDGIPAIPGASAVTLYDDKIAQSDILSRWMPATTVHLWEPEKIPALPFISKSAHGSGSHNVRLIRREVEARAEIVAAFGEGIAATRGMQRGYLIWQEFVAGNDGDVRVCLTGDYLFGLVRDNRPDLPFASGSGSNRPIVTLDQRTRAAFEMALLIADELGSRWCCFDFVFRDGQPLCLEISFAWSEAAYTDCVLFDRDLAPTARRGREWPGVAVDELERMGGKG